MWGLRVGLLLAAVALLAITRPEGAHGQNTLASCPGFPPQCTQCEGYCSEACITMTGPTTGTVQTTSACTACAPCSGCMQWAQCFGANSQVYIFSRLDPTHPLH